MCWSGRPIAKRTFMKQEIHSVFKPVPAVNFHLWQPCNMRCRFCFATFNDVKQTVLPKGHLPKEDALKVVRALCKAGFEKITFVGGEPTLCPWLIDLIREAKRYGLTTMLVTNGSRLSDTYLQQLKPVLDWLCLSIDSVDAVVNEAAGRKQNSKAPFNEAAYMELVMMIKHSGFRLKINTVVHALNYHEDISSFIKAAAPERWKLFRVLPVEGQNNGKGNAMLITTEQFAAYVNRHKQAGLSPVAEDNSDMQGSYAMVDPAGRFYDSSNGFHVYSESILKEGVEAAYTQVTVNKIKFNKRGGNYAWTSIK